MLDCSGSSALGQLVERVGCSDKFDARLIYIKMLAKDSLVLVKDLFVVDALEIKKDVIENVKSYDGDALVSGIDAAMVTGDWGEAQEVWAYIKSRRKKLKNEMSAAECSELKSFIASKRAERVYILERGSLEDYLPTGYRTKNLAAC